MSVVAPIAACGAGVPIVVDLARGHTPSALALAGCCTAILAVALVSRDRSSRGSGIGLAVAAALGFGGFFALLGPAAQGGAEVWAATVARIASLAVAIAVVVRTNAATQQTRPRTLKALPGRALALALAAGLLDALASVLFGGGTQHDLPGVVAVLASLYPIATIVLARVVLQERWTRDQRLGSCLAIIGVALIAAL